MALIEHTLLGTRDKVQEAIQRIQAFEPPEGYYCAFSGGKDSQAVYHLLQLAGVKFDAHYAVTTVDPPPLVKFIKDVYPDVSREMSHYTKDTQYHKAGEPVTMWKLIVDRGMPPTRKARYCCAELKETKGNGRLTVTGVRWEESSNRRNTHGVVDLQGHTKKTVKRADEVGAEYKNNGRNSIILNNDNDASRQVVEHCFRKARTTLNPIVDWSEEDVWEFLNDVAKVPHCRLYDEGYTRLGCIGCPMASTEQRKHDFERFPKYKDAYIRAFQRMIDRRKEREKTYSFTQRFMVEESESLVPPPYRKEERGHSPEPFVQRRNGDQSVGTAQAGDADNRVFGSKYPPPVYEQSTEQRCSTDGQSSNDGDGRGKLAPQRAIGGSRNRVVKHDFDGNNAGFQYESGEDAYRRWQFGNQEIIDSSSTPPPPTGERNRQYDDSGYIFSWWSATC